MSNNTFFKPTPLYKEFMILDLIEKNKDITQREIAENVGMAVSLVNNYIDEYERKGFVKRKRYSTKTVEYFVTEKGTERKKVLNISYLNGSLKVFKSASENIIQFVNYIINKGFSRIILYGAGEVAEILLNTLIIESDLPIIVLGVIDDDPIKQLTTLVGFPVFPLNSIRTMEFDGILISSYTNQNALIKRLESFDYPKNKILLFFE